MKIGFLTSHRAQKQFNKEYWAVINFLEKKGIQVVHSMETTMDALRQLSYAEREKIFLEFYRELEECDMIIVENSVQSTQVGWGLGYLRGKGKPIVVLYMKNIPNDTYITEDIFSNVDNMMAYAYTPETIASTLEDALSYMETHVEKRFTIIFPAELFAKLEEISHNRKLPKAVFIRQLIQEKLAI